MGQKGSSLLEIIVGLAALGIIFAYGLPVTRALLYDAALYYEAANLTASLRELREESRGTAVNGGFSIKELEAANALELKLIIDQEGFTVTDGREAKMVH